MRLFFCFVTLIVAIVWALPSEGQEKTPHSEFENVKKCVEIQNDSERLACYDQAMIPLEAALESGDLVVMDKEEIESVKKDGFGLNLPSLSGLGGIFKGDGKSDLPKDVDSVELVIEKTKEFGYKKTRFYFTNGQIWEQIDTSKIRIPRIKNGETNMALIKKAALGSFSLRVNGKGKKIKVKRIQ